MLFALANLARKVDVDAEEALRGTVGRFIARFTHVEAALAARGVAPGKASLAEMDRLWDEAKELKDQRIARVNPAGSSQSPVGEKAWITLVILAALGHGCPSTLGCDWSG